MGGVDAPALPTPGLNDEPASIVEAATEAAAAEADAARDPAAEATEDEVEPRKEA